MLVFYETTQACDLVCFHCRACAQTEPSPEELFTGDALRLIEQLAEFPDPPMLVFTGGDPLKRRDIYRLVEAAVAAGLSPSITPSATPLATYDALRRLRDAGISRVAISLDGATPAAHDAFRGVRGSFARTLEILADALSLHLPTQVNTTLHRGNVDQIEAMAALLAAEHIALWSVFFLVPVGRAKADMRLSADECEDAFARLWREARQRRFAIKTTEAPHYRRYVILHQHPSVWEDPPMSAFEPPKPFSALGINDGKGVMFVSHQGKIYPSGFLPIECGSFPLDHVVDVYQNSPIFQSLRDPNRLEGKCGVCEFRRLCGGSRARAYAVTGNLFAQEPDCDYLPAAWQ
jgi:radical SAM protein